jgi:hypothetical protein|tara:strand:+ start:386 stop:997 length:612 start_codon:yes stop_codon:yes gene_type:complete
MPFIGVQPASALLTSADIQDGQITTAKVADDAITGAKIENNPTIAGTLNASAGLTTPSGHVVQTTLHKFTTATSLNSSSNADIGGSSFTFTPKFSSSLLILSCSVCVNIYRGNINQGCTINFNVDGSNIDYTGESHEILHSVPSGNTNGYVRFQKEASLSASNTNAKTVKLNGRPYQIGSSGVANINPSSYFTSSIKIQEIAQ